MRRDPHGWSVDAGAMDAGARLKVIGRHGVDMIMWISKPRRNQASRVVYTPG